MGREERQIFIYQAHLDPCTRRRCVVADFAVCERRKRDEKYWDIYYSGPFIIISREAKRVKLIIHIS